MPTPMMPNRTEALEDARGGLQTAGFGTSVSPTSDAPATAAPTPRNSRRERLSSVIRLSSSLGMVAKTLRSRSRGVGEAEEPVDAPAAVRSACEHGHVASKLSHTAATRIAPGLLECAKLGRVVRGHSARRYGEREVHVLERRPTGARHRFHAGGTANGVEGGPLEDRAVGVERP